MNLYLLGHVCLIVGLALFGIAALLTMIDAIDKGWD